VEEQEWGYGAVPSVGSRDNATGRGLGAKAARSWWQFSWKYAILSGFKHDI